ncbi:GNAT family N-acetyltransferase [Flavivirga eckloniae]|uniref:RimJ/RimL family protein N-acetyltransferase n=1 Tax=Flavivirga eckloniae TaxID=1803846 RepID=A0A2K9PRN4_9FLAO|nr:GNAT family N-acetyltransferase [Flavivirga eckloniae]AUP79730.1 RimJ/RimL family protein N-acetyltransferase [Flavivirga eckloniae]
MIVAETNRLLVEKFTLKDASFFKELVNTPHWLKYIGDRSIRTTEDAESYIRNTHLKSYEDSGFGFYKLLLKEESNKPIGSCGLVKREGLDDVDIGFAFLPEYEGKGFGYESSVAILKMAKEQFRLKRVVAITLPTNLNSIKLLEKLGFICEKKVKLFEDDEELLLFAKNI